jgi:hypothetical protein
MRQNRQKNGAETAPFHCRLHIHCAGLVGRY